MRACYLSDGNLEALSIVFRAIPASQRISFQHLQATALEIGWYLEFKAGGVSSTLVSHYMRIAILRSSRGGCTVYCCLCSVMGIESKIMVNHGLHYFQQTTLSAL